MTEAKSRAAIYESLLMLFRFDKVKAYYAYKNLPIQEGSILPSFTSELSSLYGFSENDINDVWRSVRNAFDEVRIDYDVMEESNKEAPFLYYHGEKNVFEDNTITVLGQSIPSLYSRERAADAVKEAVKMGITVIAPLEPGLPAFALSRAISEGGKAVGVLYSFLSKCPNEALAELQKKLYEKGTLVTQFGPERKTERVNVVFRNMLLSEKSKAILLFEERDGGPTWPIFDGGLKNGKAVMLESAFAKNPNYRFPSVRLKEGATEYKKVSDLKKLVPGKRVQRVRKSPIKETGQLDLFT